MYEFIRNQYIMGKIDAIKVQSYVPKYITQEQADSIIAEPQDGVLSAPQTEV